MASQKILIDGEWREAHASSSFHAFNPATGEQLAQEYPISTWEDCDRALAAAAACFPTLSASSPEKIAAFLEGYATNLEARKDEIVAAAAEETALPASPRLGDVEFPRTTGQLRKAAAAARQGSWSHPVIDSALNIRSHYVGLGPVVIFGPNNFPFAFNGISGGDFAAAIAAGNPVIAKAHPAHPKTSTLLAEEALKALKTSGLPMAAVQMLYGMSNEDGTRLVSDPRIGATGFTGSRNAGLALKAAADKAGKPIYLELSSLNPIVVLDGALEKRGPEVAKELAESCLMGVGQFCTSPNLILIPKANGTEGFVSTFAGIFRGRQPGALLSGGGLEHLDGTVQALVKAGAKPLTGGKRADGPGFRFQNTVLTVDGNGWLEHAEALQKEAFGNATMLVVSDGTDQTAEILDDLEGNLTGAIYSDPAEDEKDYARLEPLLRRKVGRLLNDKAPTGVAVSPAMNHGGPYPSTGHPGFTSVGIPASLIRFAQLQSYDNVAEARLPAALRNANPNGQMWREIDGKWTQGSVGA